MRSRFYPKTVFCGYERGSYEYRTLLQKMESVPIVKNVRAVSPHIGIMIDTKGPEVRTTDVKEPIHYNIGDVVKIFGRPENGVFSRYRELKLSRYCC